MAFKISLLILLLTVMAILSKIALLSQEQLPHQMYIWQRAWTPELEQSINEWQDELLAFRILSIYSKKQKLKNININWQALPKDKAITLVIRINGKSLPPAQTVYQQIKQQLAKGKEYKITGIEIDYDAPTAKLKSYQQWLRKLNQHLKTELNLKLSLSITALPTWASSKALPQLLAELDSYVLQVHSVLSPKDGLFDNQRTIKWAQQFNQLAKTPFSIAMPDYWYTAQIDKQNQIKSLTAENIPKSPNQNSQQLFANPKDLHHAIQTLEKLNLKQLKSWIWFRLPTSRDKNIFANNTLKQLINTKSHWQFPNIKLTRKPIANSQNYDLWLTNPTTIDQTTTNTYTVPKNCQIKHLIQPYHHKNKQITLKTPQLFKPKQQKRIGWVQCSILQR